MKQFFRLADLAQTLVASISFVVLMEFSIQVVLPLQEAWIVVLENHAMLLFLPHGVRVLTAWLYGWRSIIYLLPGHLMAHTMLWSTAGLTDWSVLVAIGGSCIGFLGFVVASHLLVFFKSVPISQKWIEVLLAGSIASIANSTMNALVYSVSWINSLAYIVGDTVGLMVLMVLLVYLFKIERTVTRR